MENIDSSFKHIAIAGNIGAGKTTLTGLLAKQLNWTPMYEEVDDNPYLYDFYKDMTRWSFSLQIYFLNKRLQQLVEISKMHNTVVQDRTIYEDARIFAPNLNAMGLMTNRDYDNYQHLFSTVQALIQPPDLIVYLRASIPTLVHHIQHRGRQFEDSLRLDYLRRLNDCYEEWIKNHKECKVLTINIDDLDFENSHEALTEIISRIQTSISGVY